MRDLPDPLVLETHGGFGEAFKRCYGHLGFGVVIEKDAGRAGHLARQRPTWAVYQANCELALAGGLAAELPISFIDVDPYGQPWPVIDAFFGSDRNFPERCVLVVNDGLRYECKRLDGWQNQSLQTAVLRYGNDGLFANYLAISRELVTEKAARAGYGLDRWIGYYCGHSQQMTHYAAVLHR